MVKAKLNAKTKTEAKAMVTVPCKKTRHKILQSDVLAILNTFHIEL